MSKGAKLQEVLMKKFTDYNGPQGLFVATGNKILPLDSAEGISAIAQSAMLTSLGSSPAAAQYQAKVQKSLKVTHDLEAASIA